jgi:hypothetical protein
MIKAMFLFLSLLVDTSLLCFANPTVPSPGDVRTANLWAGHVKIGITSTDTLPCGNDIRAPNSDFPFVYDDRIRGRINQVRICLEVWMRGVTDVGPTVDLSLINVEVIYQMNGKRVSKKLTPGDLVGNNQIFVWELSRTMDPFLANSGLGSIMYGLLPDSKTVLWEDSEWVLASVPLDFFFTVNGNPLVSPTLGNFVLDFIGQSRKTHIVQGPIPKVLEVEIACQSGLVVGTTAKGFVIEIFNLERGNNLIKTLSALNRFQGTVIRNIDELAPSVALPFFLRGPRNEDGSYLFQVGPMTSMAKVKVDGKNTTLEISTGLLPETQSVEWSHSFDRCEPTERI